MYTLLLSFFFLHLGGMEFEYVVPFFLAYPILPVKDGESLDGAIYYICLYSTVEGNIIKPNSRIPFPFGRQELHFLDLEGGWDRSGS